MVSLDLLASILWSNSLRWTYACRVMDVAMHVQDKLTTDLHLKMQHTCWISHVDKYSGYFY